MSDAAFQSGDEVSYVVIRQTGRGMSISAREGKVVEISGGLAIVKARNGKQVAVRTDSLRAVDQPNALTEAMTGAK
tara:strand:+ start:838 stop:1065 length:228 start_codon:yes stop_codon:yes gene_type:complete